MTNFVELAVLEAHPGEDLRVWAASGDDRACHRIPFASEGIARAEAFVGQVEELIQGGDKPSADDMRQLGDALFAVLFQGEALRLFDSLPSEPVTLAIVSPDARVLNLPWEFIRFPSRPTGPDTNRPLVRLVLSVGSKKLPKREGSIAPRVLFVAAQPLDEVAIGWERQEVLIRDRLKLFDTAAKIDVVRTPTRKALTEALDGDVPYDVVHFVGHGKDGKLALVNDKNKTDTISANDFALLLSDRGIRMAVLSACRSAAGAFERDFGVVAPSVVRGGVPAVLAMQYSVPALTAAEFVGLFYKQLLAKKQTLDGALVEARKQLAIRLGTDAVEWGVPVLYRGLAAANPFA